jgi:hypothetical protein
MSSIYNRAKNSLGNLLKSRKTILKEKKEKLIEDEYNREVKKGNIRSLTSKNLTAAHGNKNSYTSSTSSSTKAVKGKPDQLLTRKSQGLDIPMNGGKSKLMKKSCKKPKNKRRKTLKKI